MTIRGAEISIPPRDLGTGFRVVVGGTLFGLGWGLTGTCPRPIFALIGNGVLAGVVVLASALAGTWVYGYFQPRLPHWSNSIECKLAGIDTARIRLD